MCSGKELRIYDPDRHHCNHSKIDAEFHEKGMSREVVDLFVAGGCALIKCHVQKDEGIIIPFDWMFAEPVHKQEDVYCFRHSFWMKPDLEECEQCERWLLSVKRGNNYLQSGVEALRLLTADSNR